MARYIDADAYKKYLDENWVPANYDVIDAQPTADVAPVTHAHWEDKREDSLGCLEWGVCSHCKNLLPALAYCGFCGAKMDEEVNNED